MGVHAGAGVWTGTVGGRDVDCGWNCRYKAVTRIVTNDRRASKRKEAGERYIYTH